MLKLGISVSRDGSPVMFRMMAYSLADLMLLECER